MLCFAAQVQVLGQGKFGVVWKARDNSSNEVVAIKCLERGPTLVRSHCLSLNPGGSSAEGACFGDADVG